MELNLEVKYDIYNYLESSTLLWIQEVTEEIHSSKWGVFQKIC